MPAPIRTTSGPLLDVSVMEMLPVEWTMTVSIVAPARASIRLRLGPYSRETARRRPVEESHMRVATVGCQ